MRHERVLCACLVAVLTGIADSMNEATADERLFTYSYEPKVLPKGAIEFEQWATMRNGHESSLFTRWDIRTEFEAGLTDRLTTALYMNWTNKWEPDKGTDVTNFSGVSSEWKYKVWDPTADPIGVLLYGEFSVDRREWEGEAKLVLGRNIGPFVLAANAVFENEWKTKVDPADPSESDTETEQVFETTAGASRRFGDVALGMEARSHTKYEDGESHHAFFVGPVLHASSERWWASATVLVQTTDDLEEHERTETRLILGIHL
jgi:hypothetical protein